MAYPSLLADGIREGLTDYLTTTFALADDWAREALRDFLLGAESGIFKGPYLRVRTPFRSVDDGWTSPLDWSPKGLRPYLHQAETFARLSSRDRTPKPTIVTTGTGSGKTESFLIPLLDHARRERARGRAGIKAVVLYPMNALVTDQARRLARLLHDEPELSAVTAGVYIGGVGTHSTATRDNLVDDRFVLRADPPDILLTNYRMLDLLLLREQDQPLWSVSRESLQYLVLDEFHTYDGAQGTDVAMLLRRFGAALGVGVPGAPLRRITPVATSATLGGGTDVPALRDFAATVFGCPFDDATVIGEQRLDPTEVLLDNDPEAIVPLVSEVLRAELPDADRAGSWRSLAAAVLGREPADQEQLARGLAQHPLVHLLVEALARGPRTAAEVLDRLDSDDRAALAWGPAVRNDPEESATAVHRLLALISAARAVDGRPWLTVEVQLWARDVRRVVRAVSEEPEFRWWTDGPSESAGVHLPAVYCRICGQSGWQALATELGEHLEGTPEKIWRAAVNDRSRLRTLLLAEDGTDGTVRVDPRGLKIGGPAGLSVVITPDAVAARADRCPACGSDEAIRFLGSSVATEMSVCLTSLFGSTALPSPEKKTLVFTDSVQDAAHRAAFIEGRAFTFNFRSAVLRAIGDAPASLTEIAARLSALADDDLYAITPPDFVRRLALTGSYLHGRSPVPTRKLLVRRLAFQVQLEAGLRSRLGRTLELTGAASVDVDVDLGPASRLAREIHANLPEHGMLLPNLRFYRVWLLGLLDRLRSRGGIHHPWLDKYLADGGRRWTIWGRAPRGMPQFPAGRAAPIAFTSATGSDFDALSGRGTWLIDWTSRCLTVAAPEAGALLAQVIPALAAGERPVLIRRTGKNDSAVYMLDPARITVQRTTDTHAQDGLVQMHCTACQHVQPTSAQRRDWLGAPCPRMRCSGRLHPAPIDLDNYYRRLYRSGRIRRLVTHEHTGLMDRATREQVESAFKSPQDATAPNVLTCTPTLELGIDIGEMSAVALASLPRTTASYLQRVGRAGRSTGNALVIATVPSAPRDLYYFAEPPLLLAGRVTPPGTYLRATELLQRQYLAFCLDEVARGSLPAGGPIPAALGPLVGPKLKPGSWLRSFCDLLTVHGDELAHRFLACYDTVLDGQTRAGITAFAVHGAVAAIRVTVADWHRRRDQGRARLAEIGAALTELDAVGHLDDAQREQLRQWRGEWHILRKADQEMSAQETFTGLVGLSLLPNYNLMDDTTHLDVGLWWTSDDEQGSKVLTSEYTVERGSRTALTEFAPGATFYAFGQQVVIDALDPGSAGAPAWSQRRLCPSCGWGGSAEPIPSCPRCQDTSVADIGAVHRLLPLTRVSASHRRDDTVIDEHSEDRIRKPFSTVTGVDIAAEHIDRAWRLDGQAFGAEYARRATIRTVNLGPTGAGGSDVLIAGEQVAATLFRTCAGCGVVHLPGTDEDRLRHRGWCSIRKGHAPGWERLALSHELTTQAVRILLPVSTFQVPQRLVAFSGAVLLGLHNDFGGDPQHLAVLAASMPDHEGRPRRFLVLHDVVPGGTGYLDRFGDPERLRVILGAALDLLAACPCREEGRTACHRCLLSVLPGRDVPLADRALAVKILDGILGDWRPTALDTVTAIDITDVHLSELEHRFRQALAVWTMTRHQGSVQAAAGSKGDQLSLSFEASDGTIRSWLVDPLVDLIVGGVGVEPDFLLTRQDAVSAPIAVYLDGKAFHASAANNHTDVDAVKRTALRDNGYRVIALTFTDVDDWELRLAGKKGLVDDLVPSATAAAVKGQVADPRVRALWGPTTDFLTALLDDPDAHVWNAAAMHLLARVGFERCPTGPVGVAEGLLHDAVADWSDGRPLPAPVASAIAAFPADTFTGVPLLALLHTPPNGSYSFGAVLILDDRPAVVGTAGQEKRWRDWLRWANLLQYLSVAPAGTARGWAEIWTSRSIQSLHQRYLTFGAPAPIVPGLAWTPEWEPVLEYTEPEIHDLVRELPGGGVAVPVPGAEVGEGFQVWQVELAWPDRRLAVVIDDDPDREDWLTSHDWTVIRNLDSSTTLENITAALAKETI